LLRKRQKTLGGYFFCRTLYRPTIPLMSELPSATYYDTFLFFDELKGAFGDNARHKLMFCLIVHLT